MCIRDRITSDETLTIRIPPNATKNWKKAIILQEKLTIIAQTSLPTATIVGSGERCAGSSTKVPIYVALTGTAPWDIKYKINTGSNIDVNGIMTSPYIIQAQTPGTYTLTYLKDNNTTSTKLYGSGTVIENAIPPVVTISSPSGATQTFDTVTQKKVQLVGSPWGGVFSGPGVTSTDSTFHSTWVPLGGPYKIKYTYTNVKGCSKSDSSMFTTSSGAYRIDFPGNKTQFCHSSAPVVISGFNSQGVTGMFQFFDVTLGVWDVPGPGKLIEMVGPNQIKIYPQRAPNQQRVYKIEYSFFQPLPLIFFDITADFTINENPTGLDFNIFSERCVNAGDTLITAAKSFVSGQGLGFFFCQEHPGIIGNRDSANAEALFRATVAGPGTHNIRYYFISQYGCMSDTVMHPVTVNALTPLSIVMENYYNAQLGVDTLKGIPAGPSGLFSPTVFFSYNADGLGKFKLSTADTFSIYYSYTDSNGCKNTTSRLLTLLNPNADIVGINSYYCYYGGAPDTIRATIKETKGTPVASGFEINKTPYAKKLNDSTIIIHPDSLLAGVDTVDFIYKLGSVPFRVQRTLKVDSIGSFDFGAYLQSQYCKDGLKENLSPVQPSYGGIGTFSLSGSGVSGDFFDPTIAAVGKDTLYCQFTRTESGCRKTISKTVMVKRLPHPKYIIDDKCITGVNTDSTIFINQTPEIDSVVSWKWDFGDLGSGLENRSSRVSPKHFYRSPGRTDVKVEVAHSNGCDNDTTIQFQIGLKPIANFYWENDCFTGDSVNFINSTTSSGLSTDTYYWHFYSATDTILDTIPTKTDVKHIYPVIGDYRVDLIAVTSELCADTISKVMHLRSTIRIADSSYYFESFNKGRGDWSIDPKPKPSTWEFGCFDTINAPADSAYFTKTIKGVVERSYINGPCFDLRGLERPMIKMNINRSFEKNRNGAVLQYSLNNGETWTTVGANISDGINWYNSFNIMSGNGPGGQGLGWSTDVPDEGWVEARQVLNELIDSSGVRFRIGYASDGTMQDTVTGFAFDNIWIGERSRKVLIEHVTNNIEGMVVEDNILNNIMKTDSLGDVLDVRYHIDYPNADEYFAFEPSAPSVRSLYYGILSAPYSIVDGGTDDRRFDYSTAALTLNNAVLNTRVLNDPYFNIFINSIPDGTNLKVQSNIVANDTIPLKEVTIHTLIVEKQNVAPNGKTYHNIVRKMLPDPAGVSVVRSWKKGEAYFSEQNWNIPASIDPTKLKVVVFVQDEKTKEVLQSEVYDSTTVFNRLIPVISDGIDFLVYPNPASQFANVLFNGITSRVTLGIYDATGRLIRSQQVEPGTGLQILNIEGLSKGFYLIRANDGKIQGVQKLVVE